MSAGGCNEETGMSDLLHGENYDHPDDGPIYEERPRRRLSALARILVIAALIAAGVAVAALIWFAYQEGVRNGAEDAAPVVRASPDPIKRKPEDAGGMAIPHQDKLVFNRIAPGQAQQPVERLLPPPEAPVGRPALPAEPAAEPAAEAPAAPAAKVTAGEAAPEAPATRDKSPVTAAGGTVAQAIADADKAASKAAAGTTPFVRAPDPVGTPVPPPAPPVSAPSEPPPEVAAVPVPPVTTAPAPSVAASPAPAAAGPAWRVQLASLTSEAAASKAWQQMQQANAALLGGLELKLQSVTLAKGTYYRVQAGPLADRAAASSLCDSLKAQKQDCLVVAP